MSGVQTLTVAPGEGEQRIDRWLRRRFPHVSQGRIEKMCRKGDVRVEGGRVKASTRLEAGQSVRVPPMPEGEVEEKKQVLVAFSHPLVFFVIRVCEIGAVLEFTRLKATVRRASISEAIVHP